MHLNSVPAGWITNAEGNSGNSSSLEKTWRHFADKWIPSATKNTNGRMRHGAVVHQRNSSDKQIFENAQQQDEQ